MSKPEKDTLLAAYFRTARAREAEAEAAAAGKVDAEAHAVACRSWEASLPGLASYGDVQAYIGGVVEGMRLGYIDGPRARALLYAAQLALTVLAERRRDRHRPKQTVFMRENAE